MSGGHGGLDRRAFCIAAAGGLAAISGAGLSAQTAKPDRLDRIGLQLYTLREMAKRDLARTLAAVARIGYSEVEFAGYFGHPAKEVRAMLDANGLTSPGSHVSMDDLGKGWDSLVDDAAVLGQKYLALAWIDERERTVEGYETVAKRLNDAAGRARRRGIGVAYHNYNYEFAPVGGTTGFDILLTRCPPENLMMEADVFWMRQAGQNPVDWFARYPGRFRMLHVKDMGPPPKNEMVDVGRGVVDWRAILSAGMRAGVEHVFVEHDEPERPLDSVRQGYRHLRRLRFG